MNPGLEREGNVENYVRKQNSVCLARKGGLAKGGVECGDMGLKEISVHGCIVCHTVDFYQKKTLNFVVLAAAAEI